MSLPTNILIFGPTGAVASSAAHEAHRRGAEVHLAMRDTTKSVPGLSNDDSEAGYTRIKADLSDSASLTKAVQESSATTAFVYIIFSSPDHMASSFAAMKAGGIKFIVLLSSFLVQGEPGEERNMAGFIGGVARTEVALKESGIKYVAVRPAYFDSNVLWNKDDIQKGEVGLVYPDVKFDFIAPSDIGIVCGAMLTEPKLAEGCKNNAVILCGPEIMAQREAHEVVIAKALNRAIKVKELSEEQWLEKHSHLPKPVSDSLLKGFRESKQGHDSYPKEMYEQAVENIRKYKGGEPMRLDEWVQANKAAFE